MKRIEEVRKEIYKILDENGYVIDTWRNCVVLREVDTDTFKMPKELTLYPRYDRG